MREFEQLAAWGLNVAAECPVADLPETLAKLLPLDQIAGASQMHLIVLGHGGRRLWENLPHPLAGSDPIDAFVREKIAWLAPSTGAEPILLYPSKRWLIPLQQLGRFLNISRPSLLGLDLNREYGPWFAYRAVILSAKALGVGRPHDFAPPCLTCMDKPCRSACPASAIADKLDLKACTDFRVRDGSPCTERCLARSACPYQSQHQYTEEQLRYHMGRPAHLHKLREVHDKLKG